MDLGQIIILILSIASMALGGKLLQLRKIVKEVSDIFPALDDVLTDAPGESQQEKIKDLRHLRKQCREAIDAIKNMFKK